MMHDFDLSKAEMRLMGQHLRKKGISFHGTTNLLPERQKLHPKVSVTCDGKGVKVDYIELIKTTTESVINIALDKDPTLSPFSKCIMHFKDGCDGAGSQAVWNSVSMNDEVQHMYQFAIVPLNFEVRSC